MIALVLGGAGSGKSVEAERLTASRAAPVTYVATWKSDAADADMAARVAAHQARRPSAWATVEAGQDLPQIVARLDGTVLIDTLGTWVAGTPGFAVDASALCRVLVARAGDTIVVSDEVGLGVHPTTAAGRQFRDALGAVNQRVAAVADPVWLVVAGRRLELARDG